MIYYLGYYKSKHINDFTKSSSNAASFKMGYVIRTIKKLGKKITVISWCPSDKTGRVPLREITVDEQQKEVYLPSFRIKKMPMRITAAFRNYDMYTYFLRNVKKEDTVIVYHATSISKALIKAKRKIGFKLVLEVEEIYYIDGKIKNPQKAKKREEALMAAADSYIAVNDLIYDKYIDNDKPHTVLYGVYDGKDFSVIDKAKELPIKLLFSGSLDKVRGSELAVETAKYLSQEYELHICGAGATSYVEELSSKIQTHNTTGQGCKIIYHGQLSEQDLDKLALSCDVGLNLQDIYNPFEAVSFPSKITFYLQHGLNVISTKMSSVLASKLAQAVDFCEYSAEGVATAVKKVKLKEKRENMCVMTQLDKDARDALKRLLE